MTSEAKIITGIGIFTVLIITVGLFFAANSSPEIPKMNIQKDILTRETNPRITSKDAKVQIVEFGDFECPACAVFAPTMKQILADYAGKIDFTFRIIPIHQHSREAAAAGYAANDQGKFIEMVEKLYENQDKWSNDTADRAKLFRQYAMEIGLDVNKFDQDITNKTAVYNAIIDQDSKDADAMKVAVTPTIIVGGTDVFHGAASYEKLKASIDNVLKGRQNTATTSTK